LHSAVNGDGRRAKRATAALRTLWSHGEFDLAAAQPERHLRGAFRRARSGGRRRRLQSAPAAQGRAAHLPRRVPLSRPAETLCAALVAEDRVERRFRWHAVCGHWWQLHRHVDCARLVEFVVEVDQMQFLKCAKLYTCVSYNFFMFSEH
jgi:hypothetical protein